MQWNADLASSSKTKLTILQETTSLLDATRSVLEAQKITTASMPNITKRVPVNLDAAHQLAQRDRLVMQVNQQGSLLEEMRTQIALLRQKDAVHT